MNLFVLSSKKQASKEMSSRCVLICPPFTQPDQRRAVVAFAPHRFMLKTGAEWGQSFCDFKPVEAVGQSCISARLKRRASTLRDVALDPNTIVSPFTPLIRESTYFGGITASFFSSVLTCIGEQRWPSEGICFAASQISLCAQGAINSEVVLQTTQWCVWFGLVWSWLGV